MSSDPSTPRILQPEHDKEMRQQQDGAEDSSQRPDAAGKPGQQIGEGSYEATRDYQKRMGDYLKKADVNADAEAAKPRSAQEARDLDAAEREGKSHARD